MINSHIISGLGYGDEGKGVTTKWLSHALISKNREVLVVRYGGGNQVGHTVSKDSSQNLHIHHHTGSGSTENVSTFYSRFCTVDPIGTVTELESLYQEGYKFKNIYDPRVMIVTPLDVGANKKDNDGVNMSVGVGFGRTIQRNEDHHHLYVIDILNKSLFMSKCDQIEKYYGSVFDKELFYEYCLEFLDVVSIEKLSTLVNKQGYDELIFEGHQGILLDMEYGVFPYVTRSKTTCKNAYRILREELGEFSANLYMVTRAYHTRHGDGPFTEDKINLKNNYWESNIENPGQGRFKTSPMDYALLEHGIKCNLFDASDVFDCNLIVTCVDQIDNSEEVVKNIIRKASHIMPSPFFAYTNHSPESNFRKHGELQFLQQ